MKKTSLGLRAKILLGGLVLVIPLVVSLAFLWQYGSGQIRTATQELAGLEASSPLIDAVFDWHASALSGPPNDRFLAAMDEYAAKVAVLGPQLAYDSASMTASGATYTGPQELKSLTASGAPGDFQKFSQVHALMQSEILYLADSSGLVLDPDLDSYYLMLALYQSVPVLMDNLSELKGYTGQTATSLSAAARLELYAVAQNLKRTLGALNDQVARSLRAIPASYGPVPDFEAAMQAVLPPLETATRAINESALSAAQGDKSFDAPSFALKLEAMAPLLDQFHDEGNKALQTMIEHRIAAFTSQLITAFGSAIVGLIGGTVLLLIVAGGIRRRTSLLVKSLGSLAQGDLGSEVAAQLLASKDELGTLAKSVKTLRDDLRTQVASISEVFQKLSLLGSNLAANSEQSAAAIEQMSATSSQVARYSGTQQDQTSAAGGQMEGMVSRIGESNQLTQGMATQFFLFSQSMEANRRRIQETAAEARKTGELAEGLNKTGEDGERTLESLRQSIGGVVKKTTEIQEIVKFILDIADRTNLLSMNAAIEAAHAGHTGRGFAVVADEIRKLAVTSAKQAQSIKNLVDSIADAADQTLVRSDATGQGFRTIRQDIASVLGASQSIAAQMAQQEAEDSKLSEGLADFTRFYGELASSMEVQVGQSQSVRQTLLSLENSSREISHSMQEQKIGMEQATEAVVQVRDTTMEVAAIMDKLSELLGRFRT